MVRIGVRLGLAGFLLGACLSLCFAQDADEFRKLFRKPETALEFWNSLNFELDVGRNDLAAKHLRGLLAKKPEDKDLLTIVDKVGLTPILKLRLIAKWSDDPKENKQAQADARELVTRTTEANRKRLNDPARMRELIAKLTASPEEKTYAQIELYKSGPLAVPYLVEAFINTTEAGDRLAYRQTLEKLGPDALPPMLAALESDATLLKLYLLDIFRKRYVRYSAQIVPHLWYVSASARQPEEVRKKAKALLADFLDIHESRLPLAKVALTAEAEKYLNKKITFGDPTSVAIWRWDGKAVVQGFPGTPTVPAVQAEEYYGLRYGQLALTLDPTYRPAQLVFLSLAVERAMDRSGPVAPLSRTAPNVAELVAKASPELITEMLEQGIKEKRTGVVLAAVRTLGERAEVRAKQPTGRAEPALVQALYYPDVRVQMTAALALVRIPGAPAPRTAARIVEILARALKPATAYRPGKKILVAIAEEDYRNQVSDAVTDTGAQAVVVSNGRDAMRRLRASSEIDAIVIDSTLPNPGLSHTLAQLRADVDAARLPVLLAAVPESVVSRNAAQRSRGLKRRLDSINTETRRYRGLLKELAANEEKERQETEKDFAKVKRPTAAEDKLYALKTIEEKYADLRKEIANQYTNSDRLLREQPKIQQDLNYEIRRYDLESQLREAALTRYVTRYPGVRVVHVSLLTEGKSLESALQGMTKDASPALTATEQTEIAEQAIKALAGLAEGKPAGYDVTTVSDTILDALRTGRLGPDGQLAAIRAVVLLTGDRPQRVLTTVVLDGKRPANVRLAALRGLSVNLQAQGRKLIGADVKQLDALSREAGLDDKLKVQLGHFIGSLRPSVRSTGERLRDHKITPTPALPPPK